MSDEPRDEEQGPPGDEEEAEADEATGGVHPANATPQQRRSRRTFVLAVLGWTLGSVLVGAALGAWLFNSYAPNADPDVEVSLQTELPPPDLGELEPIRTPDVIGLSRSEAVQAMLDAGLPAAAVVVEDVPWVGPSGRVVAQDPVRGTLDPVRVTVSVAGPATVPDVVGLAADEAVAKLEAIGALAVKVQQYVPGAKKGTVAAIDPPVGQPATEQITLTVATAASAVFASSVDTVESDCSGDEAQVNAVEYPESLVCSVYSRDESVVDYALNRRIDRFTATVGQSDESDVGGVVHFEVIGDGQPLASVDTGFGESKPLDVATTGILRLQLVVRVVAPAPDGSMRAVWGDAQFLGADDAVDQLAGEAN